MHAHAHTHIAHTRAQAHTHTRTHAHTITRTHNHTHPHTHKRTHSRTHKHTHTPPRTNAHAHTHTRACTDSQSSPGAPTPSFNVCTRVAPDATRHPDSTRILWVRRQGPSWQTRSAPRVSHPSLLQSVWRPGKHMAIEKRGSHVTLVVTVVTTVVRWTCQQQGGERNGSTSGNHLSLLSGVAFGTWPFEAHALNTTWCGNRHYPVDSCFPLGLDRGELA